jgi:hypothetical protein
VSPGPAVRLRAQAIGATAHAALARTGGSARALARLGRVTYVTAGDEILWLADAAATLHPRAIITSPAAVLQGQDELLVQASLPVWRPATPALADVTLTDLVGRGRHLALLARQAPGGFGALLAGRPAGLPLDGARETAQALVSACARDDPVRAGEIALTLLGLGSGLTPSGDDFVGGALFARALLTPLRPDRGAAWRRAADQVVNAAPARTHPVSAALLGDLAIGQSWQPLHDLLGELAAGRPEGARAAAGRLVRLGHTSGWDMLAGVLAGLGVRSA